MTVIATVLIQFHSNRKLRIQQIRTTISAASAGWRFTHLTILSIDRGGLAAIGSPLTHRSKSSAIAAAESYRLVGSLFRHFIAIVVRSRSHLVGRSGSLSNTASSVSRGVGPWNGGRPVRHS